MKKFTLTGCFFLSIVCSTSAQLNQYWTIPPYYVEFDFSLNHKLYNLPFTQLQYHDPLLKNQGDGVFDPQGQLLFYANAEFVYGRTGVITDYFRPKMNLYTTDINNNQMTHHGVIEVSDVLPDGELCILPAPNNCNRYYVFSRHAVLSGAFPNTTYFYQVYDVEAPNTYTSLNNPGAFVYDEPNTAYDSSNAFRDLIPISYATANGLSYETILNAHIISGGKYNGAHIAVSKKRPDGAYYIFISDHSSNVYRCKLDHSGLNFDNYHFYFGGGGVQDLSELELFEKSTGETLIAIRGWSNQSANLITIGTLDYNFNLMSSSNYALGGNAQTPVRGIEFSPNGQYLYFSQAQQAGNNNQRTLGYINIATNQVATLSTSSSYAPTVLELAPDGKIYGKGYTNLFRITDPNHPNLPNILESYNPINYTGNPINYANTPPSSGGFDYFNKLPKQIDGMNYLDHFFASQQCCIQYESYAKETFYSGSSGTWSAANNPLNNNSGAIAYIRDALIIRAGHTITINNMQIHFAPGAKLIIEKGTKFKMGGKLILTNGSKLTADTRCTNEAMWQGVIVEGNPGLPQIYNLTIKNQASIEVYGNSTIEHALVGIMAGNPNHLMPTNFNYSPAGGGGVVICDGANFRNNVYDVRFQDYTYSIGGLAMNNLSHFKNTNFFTDASLNIPSLFPIAHLSLVNVRGIKVNSCTFENRYLSLDNNTSLIRLGTGINTQNSTLYVGACNIILLNQPCTNGGVTYFGNLQYGINALSSDPTRTVYCRDAYFDKNTYGINLMGMANAFIYKNEVIVPKLNKKTYGVFMKYCTNYVVEENFVKSNLNDGSPGYYNLTYGIVVEGSNHHNPQVNNRIYKNYLTEIGVATQSQGLNGSTNSPSDIEGRPTYGLAWRCNEYSNQMLVAMSYPNGRVKYDQGVCNNNTNFHTSSEISKSPAGNRFINFDLFSSMGIYTGSYFDGQINYVHHEDNSQPSELIPGPNAGVGFSLEDCDNVPFNYNGAASCPERVFGNSFTTGNYNWSSLFALREQRLALTSQVNNANFEDNYFNGMYSIEEITSFLWTKNVVSDYLLSKYLDLNPPREYYMDIITGINDGLSEPIATKIIQKIIDGDIEGEESEIEQLMLVNTSKYSKLISELSFISEEEDYLFSNLMTYYYDSDNNTGNFIDSLLTYLESDTNISRQNLYMYLLLDMGRFEDAYTIAEIVAYKSGLNYDHFMTLFNLYKNLYSSSETIEELVRDNESRYSALQFLSENGNNEYIQYCAQQLLNSSYQIFEKTYHIEDVLLDEEQGNKPAPPQIKNTQETASVVIYPNPSLDFINVIARGKDAQTFDRIEVTNMLGQSVIIQNVNTTTQHSLSIENLSTGSYIIRVFNNKLPIHQQVIIKK